MILSDTAILEAIDRKAIVIEPFDKRNLGGNSYDVHLAPTLLTYASPAHLSSVAIGGLQALDALEDVVLDVTKEPKTWEHEIPEDGMVLHPGILYLGATLEYTETHEHVPYLDGRSSTGRAGISIHATAGRGDVGFCNHWTMEITVSHPIRVRAGMRIGQLTYHTVHGDVERVYARKERTTYGHMSRSPKPVPTGLWRNFQEKP